MSNIVLNNVSANARIFTVKCATALEQGNVAILGAKDAEGVYAVSAPAAITDLQAVIIADVPLDYEAEKVQGDHKLAANTEGRAYLPYKGFTITVEDAQITGTDLAKGDFLILPTDTTYNLTKDADGTLGGTESLVFVIDDKTTLNGVAASMIRCIKCL